MKPLHVGNATPQQRWCDGNWNNKCIHGFSSMSWKILTRISRFNESMDDKCRIHCAKHLRVIGHSSTHHNEDSSKDQQDDGREKPVHQSQGKIFFMSMFNDIE